MADKTTKTPDAAVDEIKFESPDPEEHFFGVTEEQLPLHLRPIHRAYAVKRKQIAEKMGLPRRADVTKPPSVDQDAKRLDEIRAALPTESQRKAYQEKLREERGLFQLGFGNTLLKDRVTRLGRILKAQGLPNNEENQQQLLDKLIADARAQVAYDPSNPLFNPDIPNHIDRNAANILNIWSMENLARQFDSPQDLYDNFSTAAKQQEDLENEAMGLLQKKITTQRPSAIHHAVVNGQRVVGVPRFNDAFDKSMVEATSNNLIRLLYSDKTSKDLFRMYAEGFRVGQSDEDLLAAMGNTEDANMIKQNAFFSRAKARPSDVYIPVSTTRDNRYGINREELQKGIENLLFHQERKKLGLKTSELSEQQKEDLRERSRNRTRTMINSLMDRDSLVVHVDPEGALRDFTEGKGTRAEIFKVASALNTAFTLGQKEKILDNLPDRIAKALIAVTLPRRTAGIVTEGGEELDFVREGDFFVPLLGESKATNMLDYILRFSVDEPLVRSFALAVDEEARSGNEMDSGRPGRIVRNMLANVGTEKHLAYTIKDDIAGGRFLTEFGDAFINPLLGTYGRENPRLGTAVGSIAALATFIASPDIFTAAAAGAVGGKVGGQKLAHVTGLTSQTNMGRSSAAIERIIQQATGGKNQVTSPDEIKDVDSFINKAARQDKTGGVAAFSLLASAGKLMDHGLAANLRSSAVRRSMEMYTSLKVESKKLLEKANKQRAAAEQASDMARKADLKLSAIQYEIRAAELAVNAEKQVNDAVVTFARSTKMRQKFAEYAQRYVDPDASAFISDAFAALRGKKDMENVAEAHGLLKGVKLRGRKDDADIKARARQVHALISDRILELLQKVETKATRAELTQMFSGTTENLYENVKGQSLRALGQIEDLLTKLFQELNLETGEYAKLDAAVRSRRSPALVEALQKRYDANIVALDDVANQLSALNSETRNLKERTEALDAMSPERIDAFVVNEYNEYLQAMRGLAKGAAAVTGLKPAVFKKMMDAVEGRARAAFKYDVHDQRMFGDELAEALAPSHVDDIYATSALIKVFKDPLSMIQLGLRLEDGIPGLFRQPRALIVWGTLAIGRVMEKVPLFSTNVRLLESVVRRDVDDAAKVIARRVQDLLDSFNIILANVDDLDEANALVRGMLTSAGGIQEVASRYRVWGTEKATLTLTGIVGRSESLIATFLRQVTSMRKTRDMAAPSDKLIENPGLSAAIQAFIDESTLANRDKFYEPGGQYDKLVRRVYDGVAKMDLSAPGDALLAGFENVIRSAILGIKEKPVTLDLSSLTTAGGMTKFYKGIVLGAMQADFFDKVANIIGPRFNPRMARAMNFLMGEGAEATDNFAKVDFMVGDYVMLRKDAELFNQLTERLRIEEKDGRIKKLTLPGQRSVVATQYAKRAEGKGFEERTARELREEFLREVTPTLEFSTVKDSHSDGFLNPITMKKPVAGDMLYSTRDILQWLSQNARGENYRRMAEALVPYASDTNPIYFQRRYNNAHSGPDHMNFDPRYFNAQIIIHEALHNVVTNRARALETGDAASMAIVEKAKAHQLEMKELLRPYIHMGNSTLLKRGEELTKKLGMDPARARRMANRVSYIFNRGFWDQVLNREGFAEIHTVPFENPDVQKFLSLIRYESRQTPLWFEQLDFFKQLIPGINDEVKNMLSYVAEHQAALLLGPHVDLTKLPSVSRAGPFPDVAKLRQTPYPQAGAVPAAGRGAGKPFVRLPKLEDLGMDALGKSAYRINKIDKKANVVYLSSPAGGQKGELLVVPLDEVLHRDVRLSLLDALDGFSIWGTGSLTSIGRKGQTDELHATRTAYQRMVAASVDSKGNVLMVPQSILNDLNESLTKIQKELDEAISEDAASTMLHSSGLRMYEKFLRWFKTHILTGLVIPRPAYFMNQLFGDFSQMWITVGPAKAANLTFMGSLAYVPVYGKALQNAYFRTIAQLPPGKEGLPTAFSAMFNGSLDKILTASEDVLTLKDGTKMTYAEFYAEAIGAGIGENIRIQDFSAAIRRTLMVERQKNPGVFGALSRAGQDLGYMQNIMEMKIREVTRRQRLLMYADARINRGLTEQEAFRELSNTLYDWSHSVGKHEMSFIGRYVLFYTLSKNAMAQVFRMFFEASDVGVKEYMSRYARGATQLQRFEVVSRLMTQYPAAMTDPYTELTEEEQAKYASMREMPKYLEEYPLLALGEMPENAVTEMAKGGYVRTHFARIFPKATTTEYMLGMLDIAASLSALAVAGGNIVDPEGKVIPLSANPEKAFESLIDSTIDQFLAPVYSDVFEDFFQELVGVSDVPASEYGLRMRNGDMEFVELLGMLGASDLAVLTQDPQDTRTKRIRYPAGPVGAAIAKIPKTEYHRFRLMLSLAFPGMAPSEIRALAVDSGPARARLEALGALLNTGKVLFYNGDSERYWKEDDVSDRLKRLENDLERQAKTPIVPTED